jgi:uncharacterized membrane protein
MLFSVEWALLVNFSPAYRKSRPILPHGRVWAMPLRRPATAFGLQSRSLDMPRGLSRSHEPDVGDLLETEEHIVVRQYNGPIPPASELQGLKNIDDSFPERVMQLAEKHAAADVRRKDRFSLVNLIVPIVGQITSFLISCMGFGIGVLFTFKGIEAGAIAAIIGGIAPIIIAALSNLRKK